MALFACNYDNMLFGSSYYSSCLVDILPDDDLYIVDTNDWIVEKITGEGLKNVWSNDLGIVNIAYDTDKDELYFVEDNIDFYEYSSVDSSFCLRNKDYKIAFGSDTRIIAKGRTYTVSYKRVDYNGNTDNSNAFNEESWYVSIYVNGKQVGIIKGGYLCESCDFGVSYAFRTKKYFVVRFFNSIDGDAVAVSIVFRGSELVDIFSSGANKDAFELTDFEPSDTLFQTKSKIKGEHY